MAKPCDATMGQVSEPVHPVHCPSMLGALWQRNKLAVIVFAGACLVAVFFAVRLALFTVYWSDPARRDATIASWQTPGYVAMSWKVPRPVIAEAIGLSEGSAPRESLKDIAARRGVPVETLIAEIEEAIAAFRSAAQ